VLTPSAQQGQGVYLSPDHRVLGSVENPAVVEIVLKNGIATAVYQYLAI
jgi:hypothetical protein